MRPSSVSPIGDSIPGTRIERIRRRHRKLPNKPVSTIANCKWKLLVFQKQTREVSGVRLKKDAHRSKLGTSTRMAFRMWWFKWGAVWAPDMSHFWSCPENLANACGNAERQQINERTGLRCNASTWMAMDDWKYCRLINSLQPTHHNPLASNRLQAPSHPCWGQHFGKWARRIPNGPSRSALRPVAIIFCPWIRSRAFRNFHRPG